MSGRIAEEEHKQILACDGNKYLAQGSGSGVRQSTRMVEIRTHMLSRGVKPVKDVKRIIIERAGNELSFISKPDVFKSPDSESYVIFGEEEKEEKEEVNDDDIEVVMAQAEVSRSEAIKALETNNFNNVKAVRYLFEKEEDIDDDDDDDDDKEEEEEIDPDHIELVMTRARVSKGKAVKALMANNGDCFYAIMNLGLLTKKEEDFDETEVADDDIELVMTLARVSRIHAITAIQACNGNLNSAILNLTSKD